jgi:aldehyde:ferredoxin oxidoreductase
VTEFKLKKIKILKYDRPSISKGYADQFLGIDISTHDMFIKPISEEMKNVFIGGEGFDLWLLWHAVKSDMKWTDSENALCIASGPMGGTPSYPGSGKKHCDGDIPHYGFRTGRWVR